MVFGRQGGTAVLITDDEFVKRRQQMYARFFWGAEIRIPPKRFFVHGFVNQSRFYRFQRLPGIFGGRPLHQAKSVKVAGPWLIK